MNPNILALQNNIPKCPICLGPINNPIKSNNCLHLFCEVCLTMWLQRKNECPICRKAIDNTTKLYYPKNLKLKNNKLNSLNYSIENLKMDNFGNYSKKCLVCGENNQEIEDQSVEHTVEQIADSACQDHCQTDDIARSHLTLDL